jgi:hypothetical protein
MRRALGLAALVLAVAACAGGDQTTAGLVTDIETLGLGQVQGFTLRTEDGASLAFTFEGGTDLAAGGFPPDHLREHMASATGVAVAYRTEGDARVAVRLSDAPWIGQ